MTVDLEKLRAPFPKSAVKQRVIGGNRKADYVEGHTVIHRLNDACPSWNFRIIKEWQDGDVLKALGELDIPGLGTRQHIGVQKISAGGGEDLHKGHVTDALKKCATLFGVGLELYGPDYADDTQPAPVEHRTTRAEKPVERPNGAEPVMITDSQKAWLREFGKRPGWSIADVMSHCAEQFNGKGPGQLTAQQAKTFVAWLQEKDAERQKGARA